MLLTPKDFALSLGLKYSTLRSHLNRKKVFKSGDFIDTDYKLNQLYIDEQTNGKGIDASKIGNSKTSSSSNKKTPAPNVKDVEPEQPKVRDITPKESREDIIYNSLTLRIKKAAAEKAEYDSHLKALEIQKKMGELMPIEMVQKILTVNVQSVFRRFETEAENVASVYCEILGGDRTHLSEMTKQMREQLQRSIKEIKEKSADEIKTVIKEYAAVRGRGQRK